MAIIRKMDSVMNMKNDEPFCKRKKRFDRDSGRIKRQNNKFEDELRPGRNGATIFRSMFTQPRTDQSGSVNAWNE